MTCRHQINFNKYFFYTGCPQKKVNFSFPVKRAKVNFFCGHPVDIFRETVNCEEIVQTLRYCVDS